MAGIVTGANPLLGLVGYGVGSALGPILRPPIQDLVNEAWSEHPVRPLSHELAAAMQVEGVWTPDRAAEEGRFHGIDGDRMAALAQLLDDPPDVQTLYALWRRGEISPDKFIEGLKHHRIETDYFQALRQLKIERLDPSVIANAVQQGHMPPGNILPPAVSGSLPFHIPLTQIDLDPFEEAAASGIDTDRLRVMANLVGLPPGDHEMLQMWNRGIIDEESVDAGIREGHRKTKWIPAVKELRHAVLTPLQAVELRLRGWIEDPEMNAIGAKSGYSPAQMHQLFLSHGRPLSFHQVFIGERRGGTYDGPTGAIDPPFLKSLQESNIRPEWYSYAWAQRHSLPSAFVMRALTQAHDISQADAERLLLWSGWPEDLAAKVSAAWAGGTGAATDPLVKTYRNRAITEIQQAYVLGQADDGQARGWLSALGVTGETQDGLLPIWEIMREVPQRGLTAAQIKKAYSSLSAQWPRSRAIEELALLGYTADDAATLLDE